MRIFFTIVLCLYTIGIWAQSQDTINNISGTYVFNKITVTTYNSHTAQEVENYTISDPALVDSMNIHLNHAYLKVDIESDSLIGCTLPNRKEYLVKYNFLLEEVGSESLPHSEYEEYKGDEIDDALSISHYDLIVAEDKVTFMFHYPFGDSRYNFPLEAKLTVVLTREEKIK